MQERVGLGHDPYDMSYLDRGSVSDLPKGQSTEQIPNKIFGVFKGGYLC
jgi:hypothetical protein